ncbi:MAG: T9SS C-terminal target domain-containing protein [Flavobacteriia bacterium]|nr:T9SS C-terminal target domain-containing protein [Flavobacteriia bacterium]
MKNATFFLFSFAISCFLRAQYCTNVGPSSNADSNVESVVLVGQSGQINHVGCPSQMGVEVYLNESTTLSAGSAYSLQVDFGTCGGNYAGAGAVWIDFDQSETFSPNEVVGTWVGTPPVATSVFNINVPVNAHNGPTRMRVTQQEGGVLPLNPCATFQWGSVMDFGIQIVNGLDCSNTPGDVMNEAIVIPSLPFNHSGDLAYCYGNQNLVYDSPDVFYRLNLNPTMQSVSVNSCGSNFDSYLSVLDPFGQVISYNDDGIGCSPASSLTFDVQDLGYVFLVLEGWGNESGLYQIEVQANYLGIPDLTASLVTIKPNPFLDVVEFSREVDRVMVYDLAGQPLASVESAVKNVNLGFLPSGLYQLHVWVNGKRQAEKLVKP